MVTACRLGRQQPYGWIRAHGQVGIVVESTTGETVELGREAVASLRLPGCPVPATVAAIEVAASRLGPHAAPATKETT